MQLTIVTKHILPAICVDARYICITLYGIQDTTPKGLSVEQLARADRGGVAPVTLNVKL